VSSKPLESDTNRTYIIDPQPTYHKNEIILLGKVEDPPMQTIKDSHLKTSNRFRRRTARSSSFTRVAGQSTGIWDDKPIGLTYDQRPSGQDGQLTSSFSPYSPSQSHYINPFHGSSSQQWQNSEVDPYNNDIHQYENFHSISGNRFPHSSNPFDVSNNFKWREQPARDYAFSNSTGGHIHCRADGGGGSSPMITWSYSNGSPIPEVRFLTLKFLSSVIKF